MIQEIAAAVVVSDTTSNSCDNALNCAIRGYMVNISIQCSQDSCHFEPVELRR
jgi:hypothetical protein